MRLLIIGFGNLGRGLVESLAEKKSFLYRRFGLKPRVVGVVDDSGAATNDKGLDWQLLVKKAYQKAKVSAFPNYKRLSALEAIESVECEIVFELTPTNIKTGEPGLTHIKSCLLYTSPSPRDRG